ncbi:MAG: hypothetical protein K5924_09300 [Chloroflexi bacterium]|nr:hypothetical protein [Chloroflexota bacterium]
MDSKPRPRLWRCLVAMLDDALPMSLRDRAARDADGLDHTKYRLRRFRLHMLEKRGKGGLR